MSGSVIIVCIDIISTIRVRTVLKHEYEQKIESYAVDIFSDNEEGVKALAYLRKAFSQTGKPLGEKSTRDDVKQSIIRALSKHYPGVAYTEEKREFERSFYVDI